jgi:adenylate cyclase class IV
VLKSGFAYQAKWSREKTDYNYLGANVTISFSPGYGYVAEFEKIITDPKLADRTKTELRQLMSELKIEELAQDRLARMFAYYNSNWQDYYGTDKVFEIL